MAETLDPAETPIDNAPLDDNSEQQQVNMHQILSYMLK